MYLFYDTSLTLCFRDCLSLSYSAGILFYLLLLLFIIITVVIIIIILPGTAIINNIIFIIVIIANSLKELKHDGYTTAPGPSSLLFNLFYVNWDYVNYDLALNHKNVLCNDNWLIGPGPSPRPNAGRN